MDGSIADNTSEDEPATGGDYVSHKHIEAQCDHNNTIEFRVVPAQSGKENGGTPPPSPDEGRLQPIAAKVLMTILYAARLCRFDLPRAVCHLAPFVTKWTSECDRKLHRLVCYPENHCRQICRQFSGTGGIQNAPAHAGQTQSNARQTSQTQHAPAHAGRNKFPTGAALERDWSALELAPTCNI